MRRDLPDFFLIPEGQEAIHGRLENWALYLEFKRPSWISPMWKQGLSNSRQWHAPVLRPIVDSLGGHDMELAVRGLPKHHRDAIRWAYVYRTPPLKAQRMIGVTAATLLRLVTDGRTMLKNRVTK